MSFSSGSRESALQMGAFFWCSKTSYELSCLAVYASSRNSQCLNVVYIVVSNYLLSRTTGGLNEGITILKCSEYISFFQVI